MKKSQILAWHFISVLIPQIEAFFSGKTNIMSYFPSNYPLLLRSFLVTALFGIYYCVISAMTSTCRHSWHVVKFYFNQ
uniref:Secreted protein n=1 Tax=Panstrongylus lignarius TaxID=156445 RepID=A0A224XT36_9HEMI